MKLTKSKLKQIIKEELENTSRFDAPEIKEASPDRYAPTQLPEEMALAIEGMLTSYIEAEGPGEEMQVKQAFVQALKLVSSIVEEDLANEEPSL